MWKRSLRDRLVWKEREGKGAAPERGRFSARGGEAVYLLTAHSPCLRQQLGCSQLTGRLVTEE